MKHKCPSPRIGKKPRGNIGRWLYAAFLTATLSASLCQPASAATVWEKANEIMRDVYTQILGISTIAAIVTAAVALLMMNFSRSGRTVDESRAWLKRIIITWAVLNGLGFIMSYVIVARTNALRAEHGIAALTADDQLMRAAQVRADEMAATGAYSHTRPDGRKYYTVTDCRQVGENIHQIPLLYLAQQKTALAETLVYSWSKSAGHMENMTDESYAAIGVGLARGTDANGLECWYCVQLFLRSGYSISAVDKPATK